GSHNQASGTYATVAGGSGNVATGNASFAGGSSATATYQGDFVWSDAAGGSPVSSTTGNQFMVRAIGGVVFYTNASNSVGATLSAGSGSWSSLSDRSAKSDIAKISDARILAKVASLPISEWSYTSERGVRHVGPMAQDFYAAFGVGEDDRHITTVDESGVALAAIKALNAKNARLQSELTNLRKQVVKLTAIVSAIKR
ncbi:MAG: tail fiber domain-containing protein, partial [Acidobacteriaceae bacterium]|nr:tail fiber domain-containing protein [Acidobacteriaceae bacterium]